MDGKGVNTCILVDARVAFAAVQAPGKRGRELADKPVVGKPQVAQLERKADEVRQEVGRVDAAIDEDGAVDVGV